MGQVDVSSLPSQRTPSEHRLVDGSMFLGVQEFIVKKSGRYINTHSLRRRGTSSEKQKGEKKQYLEQPLIPNTKTKNYQSSRSWRKKMEHFKNYLEQCTIKCAEQKSEIYISGGLLFPCCCFGQPFKWWKDEKKGDVHEMIGDYDKINLKKVHRNIRDIVEGDFFKSVQDSWSRKDRLETVL